MQFLQTSGATCGVDDSAESPAAAPASAPGISPGDDLAGEDEEHNEADDETEPIDLSDELEQLSEDWSDADGPGLDLLSWSAGSLHEL